MKDRELERINRVVRVNKKGDPKIVDMARFYTANEALELYYSRKSKGEDVRFFCVGSSRYSDYCNAPMNFIKVRMVITTSDSARRRDASTSADAARRSDMARSMTAESVCGLIRCRCAIFMGRYAPTAEWRRL